MKMENNNEDISRREIRKKRRNRNQILAYVVMIVLTIGIFFGIFIGGKFIGDLISKKQENEMISSEEATGTNGSEMEDNTEPVEELEPEVDLLGELVDSYIAEMTIEEKVAGLFITTPESITGVDTVIRAGDGTKAALEEYPVGGILYSDKNIQSEEQLKEMINNTIEFSNNPIFITVGEEGGEVATLGNADIGVEQMPNMEEIGNGDPVDDSLAGTAGTTIGTYLSDYGFNVNFAPVGDVITNPESPQGARSFSGDPAIASDMVEAFVKGLQDTDVSSCVKYFPGIGDVEVDTHNNVATTDIELDVMRTREFLPFVSGIEADTDFIMVGHIIASAIDAETPSSLSSKVVTDILRMELGFQGIIVTDILDVKSITDNYEPDEVAIKAIEAGVDMILIPEDFEQSYESLLNAVIEGTITEARIDESLKRIYRVKLEDAFE